MARKKNTPLTDNKAQEEHRVRMARNACAWRAARVRKYSYSESVDFVRQVEAGVFGLDQKDVDAEVENYLTTVRCHDKCKDYVRQYGEAPYSTTEDPTLCQVCARPLTCVAGRTEHEFREMTQGECRASGIYHGGNCYHVSVCVHCGFLYEVDSSD